MNILAIFAHPDDETMLSGGTLALLAKLGATVHYVSATRGEGGEPGEPPLCIQSELGEIRAQELACAVRTLGGISLEFMGYIDPQVGEEGVLFPFLADPMVLRAQIQESIHRHQIGIVITHGSNGEYGHPAHRLVHDSVYQTVSEMGENAPLLYTTQAAFPQHPKPRLMNKDDPAHLILDITPVFDQKVRAALCHRTQHALFIRRPSRETGRQMTVPEVIVRIESLHRAWPAVEGRLEDELVKCLNRFTVQD